MPETLELQSQSPAMQQQIPRRPLSSTHSSVSTQAKDGSPTYSAIAQEEREHDPRLQSPRRAFPRSLLSRPAWARWRRWTFDMPPRYMMWMPETLSLVFALLTLLAMVILLLTRQNKPLPEWPSALQVNSLVSVFSSLFKVALLFPITEGISELKWIWFASPNPVSDFDRFDAAARGPWGSLKLIAKKPLNVLTSFGAVIVIFALAIDPFTQQVVQFYSCSREIQGLESTIPRTGYYARANPTQNNGYFANAKMLGAIYQGLLRPSQNATTEIYPYCPLGNCTFSHVNGIAYSSLAICKQVTDISSEVDNFYSGNSTSFDGAMSLPSGLTINGTNSEALATATVSYDNSSLLTSGPPLFTMQLLSIRAGGCGSVVGDEKCFIPFAANVTLTPCVQDYSSVSVSGTIFERTSNESTPLTGSPSSGYGLFGQIASPPDSDCSFSRQPTGNKTVGTGIYYGEYPETVVPAGGGEADQSYRCADPVCVESGLDIQYYDPACAFALASAPSQGLFNTFQSLFGSIDSPNFLTLNTSDLGGPVTADAWVEAFWDSGLQDVYSVSNVTEGLLYSVNAVIVSDGDVSNSAPATGTVLGNETCVGVAWAWLTLPIILLALTVAFLVFTIFTSHRSTQIGGAEAGRKPWKSASSPLLWCGVQDATREKYGSVDAVQEMKDRGDETYVRLDRYDHVTNAAGRWVLREHAPVTAAAKPRITFPKMPWPSKFQRLPSFSMLRRSGRASSIDQVGQEDTAYTTG